MDICFVHLYHTTNTSILSTSERSGFIKMQIHVSQAFFQFTNVNSYPLVPMKYNILHKLDISSVA